VVQQVGPQWDLFDLNRSEQLANRCERFTSADRHKNGIPLNGAQVRLGGFSDRPGQFGLVHKSFHNHDLLVLTLGPKSG
jgi:hypothetical protein